MFRRDFLRGAGASLATAELVMVGPAKTTLERPTQAASPFAPIRQIAAGALDVGYSETGPDDGPAVLLLHGFPYSIDSYVDVAPMLAARGCRVIVPWLRGHGTTRFAEGAAPCSGQQAAIGVDAVALMDALKIDRAVLAGYDWGGRAACVVAALWPERCAGLVSVNGYLIQDFAKAAVPLAPAIESGYWYQFYFLTERGRAGLAANRRELARTLWTHNSPNWRFDDATLDRHAPRIRQSRLRRRRHPLVSASPRSSSRVSAVRGRGAQACPAAGDHGARDHSGREGRRRRARHGRQVVRLEVHRAALASRDRARRSQPARGSTRRVHRRSVEARVCKTLIVTD
jgi:pimeloyl-ACP methyl ester carboxylesterase